MCAAEDEAGGAGPFVDLFGCLYVDHSVCGDPCIEQRGCVRGKRRTRSFELCTAGYFMFISDHGC